MRGKTQTEVQTETETEFNKTRERVKQTFQLTAVY